MDYLDDKYKESVPIDNEIYREFASSWEEKFHEDMRKLNIKEPNALTRVSDFIEEIIEFTQTIIGINCSLNVKLPLYKLSTELEICKTAITFFNL